MRIPIIKVKDGNFEHIVGTNSHDVLYVDEQSGGIQYMNMQSCEGTKRFSRHTSICFVGEPMEECDVFGPGIKFVTVEELIEIALQQMKDGTEAKLKLHAAVKNYMEEKGICQKKLEEDNIQDSGGALLFLGGGRT